MRLIALADSSFALWVVCITAVLLVRFVLDCPLASDCSSTESAVRRLPGATASGVRGM
jgi:hypothetical protein